uniref:Uncharacterized protein n=1 Tax=Avena sativa TaxID=4498 RepID=A0ACD5XWV0_AVESA
MASKAAAQLLALSLLLLLLLLSSTSSGTATGGSQSTYRRRAQARNTCPIDVLRLGLCAAVLGNAAINIGPSGRCCTLLAGVADLEAATCLCTAITTGVLPAVPLQISVILNDCGRHPPGSFTCA